MHSKAFEYPFQFFEAMKLEGYGAVFGGLVEFERGRRSHCFTHFPDQALHIGIVSGGITGAMAMDLYLLFKPAYGPVFQSGLITNPDLYFFWQTGQHLGMTQHERAGGDESFDLGVEPCDTKQVRDLFPAVTESRRDLPMAEPQLVHKSHNAF